MGRYLSSRTDANASAIRTALKQAGVSVWPLGRPVDLLLYSAATWAVVLLRLQALGITVQARNAVLQELCGPMGTVLAEVKTAKGRTRSAAQAKFLAEWTGLILILRSGS